MFKFVKFRLGGLWNTEYPLVIKRLIDLVGRFAPEMLRQGRAYANLVAFKTQLDRMEKQELADADSIRLSELDQLRDTLFSVILNVAMHFKRTPMLEFSSKAQVILELLKKHGHDIPAANYTAETKRMHDMCNNFHRLPEAMTALEQLALLPLFAEMETANNEFDQLFINRHQRQAEAEPIDARALRSECDMAVTDLWDAILFCTKEYGESDYRPLVNVINKHNGYYKQQLAARATRRKNKEDVGKEQPIPPMSEE